MGFRAPSSTSVDLIPWDHESADHTQRLIDQRIECGWHADKPDGLWKRQQGQGTKCIYWVVIRPDDTGVAQNLKAHISPEQRIPLLDTCATLMGAPVVPTRKPFIPVGHIGLDTTHPDADKLSLDKPTEAVIWVKSLFITKSLQCSGLGRAAMDTLEAMAASEPLSAKTLMLDTMEKDDQMKLEAPKVSTQAWYERRGYRTIHEEPGFYNDTEVLEAKAYEGFVARTVFMRMDLA